MVRICHNWYWAFLKCEPGILLPEVVSRLNVLLTDVPADKCFRAMDCFEAKVATEQDYTL